MVRRDSRRLSGASASDRDLAYGCSECFHELKGTRYLQNAFELFQNIHNAHRPDAGSHMWAGVKYLEWRKLKKKQKFVHKCGILQHHVRDTHPVSNGEMDPTHELEITTRQDKKTKRYKIALMLLPFCTPQRCKLYTYCVVHEHGHDGLRL